MKIIKTSIIKFDDNNEVLRFYFGRDEDYQVDVRLTNEDGVEDLKTVFQLLLAETLKDNVLVGKPQSENNPTGLYVDVCNEYVLDLNRELASARKQIIEEGLAETSMQTTEENKAE